MLNKKTEICQNQQIIDELNLRSEGYFDSMAIWMDSTDDSNRVREDCLICTEQKHDIAYSNLKHTYTTSEGIQEETCKSVLTMFGCFAKMQNLQDYPLL